MLFAQVEEFKQQNNNDKKNKMELTASYGNTKLAIEFYEASLQLHGCVHLKYEVIVEIKLMDVRGGSRNFGYGGCESGLAGPLPTNQQKLYFEVILFTNSAPFTYTKPRFLDCSYSGVVKK